MQSWHPPSWALPLIVAALVVPTALGFALMGPALGLAVGTLSAAALIVAVSRLLNRGPLEVRGAEDGAPVMIVAIGPIEEREACSRIADLAAGERVLVIAPAMSGAVARWLSDVDPARFDAQRDLAISIANLTAAGVEAEGRVGDGDPMQATTDALRLHGAREVHFYLPEGAGDGLVTEVGERLDRPVGRIAV